MNLGVPLTGDAQAPSALSDHDARLRGRYLKAVARDISDKLRGSLHHAPFIDLEIDEDPAAVKPPWGYYNPEKKQHYGTVEEAFEGSDRRLLLLGSPGAGKTTALLHVAEALAKKADASPDAPIPVVVNLSKFRLVREPGARTGPGSLSMRGGSGSSDPSRRFEDWLVDEIATFPGLARETARAWLRDGRLAALLDGLDEFDEEHRAELAEMLNTTFLRHHPDLAVAICSRSNEYAVLQGNARARLEMGGAVHLQPLTDTQVAIYLKAANAKALLLALPNDEGLKELARTPLTLSMLVLAYGGKAPTAPIGASLSESRFHLFDSYVARMLQRQARRAQGVAFDNVSGNDVAIDTYCYSPRAIDRWLGWLAVTLSVQMRTSFSPGSMTNLLLNINEPRRQPLDYCIATLAVGLIMVAALTAIAIAIVPPTLAAAATAAAMIAAGWLSLPLIARPYDNALAEILALLAAIAAAILSAAMLAHLSAEALSGSVSPYAIAPVLMAAGFAAWLLRDNWNPEDARLVVLTILAPTAFLALIYIFPGIPGAAAGWIGTTASAWGIGILPVWLVLAAGLILARGHHSQTISNFLISVAFLGGTCAALAFATFVVGQAGWGLVLATSVLAAAAMVAFDSARSPALSVAAIAPGPILGGALAGAPGALVGGAAAWFASLLLTGEWSGRTLKWRFRHRARRLFERLDSLMLSRVTLALLACWRRQPFRHRLFLESSVDAFLLKRSGPEFEFVHRLLRDHFALREIRPRLASDHANRLETIRSLGYQGEAALDMLIEYVEQGDAPVRAAAIAALGLIPSPASTARIASSAEDTDTDVRVAVIKVLGKVQWGDRDAILSRMVPIQPAVEVPALLSTFAQRWVSPAPADPINAVDWAVVEYVRRMGDGAADALIAALNSGPQHVRVAALQLLGACADDGVLEAIINQAVSGDSKTRGHAAAALGWQLPSAALDALELLTRDPVSDVRRAAAYGCRIWRQRHGLPTPDVDRDPFNW